jgi:hypothetical protein
MTLKQISTGMRVYREQGIAGFSRLLLGRVMGDGRKRPANESEIWSEYMNWLTFANAGMLERGNVYCFDHAIRNLPSSAPIVEIGSFCGLSTNMMSYLKERHSVTNPLFTCDKWIFEGAETGVMLGDSRTVSHADYREFVKESFLRNARIFSANALPHTIEATSDEFFSKWSHSERQRDVFGRDCTLGGPISFCYIDGNHTYEFARRDFENADSYLEPGGFLLFDDSEDGSGWEVCRVVREVMDSQRYELVSHNPNYFFRKK